MDLSKKIRTVPHFPKKSGRAVAQQIGLKPAFKDTLFFHSQVRIGRGRKAIVVTKLRTMKRGAHADYNGEARNTEQYLTRIGKRLRKTHLDELPQVISWLKGNLALVGLRPLTRQEYKKLPPELKKIYDEVGPGLLGLQYACTHFPPTRQEMIDVAEEFYRMWKKNKTKANLVFAKRILKNFGGKDVYIHELK